jgi:hypothetical protein
MIVDKPEIFFKEFPYKYWLYKAEMIKSLLDNNEKFQDSNGTLEIFDGSLKEYQQMLKHELHFTYYHQAEALFELIFALEKLDDKYTWLILSESYRHQKKYAEKINEIAGGSNKLFDKEVKLKSGKSLSFIEWLLYDAYGEQIQSDELKTSLVKAKEIIQIIAKDLSDKAQYNAFKHGMRVLPLWKYFSIKAKDKEKKGVKFDLENSFTFLSFPKDRSKIDEVTIGYSPDQDLLKINLITLLMKGIIGVRKDKYFNKEKGQLFHFVDVDFKKKIQKANIGIHRLVHTTHFDNYNKSK